MKNFLNYKQNKDITMKFLNPLLILFRHGQTDYNVEKRFQGQINCPLNINGLQQAQQTGEIVSSLLTDIFNSFPNSKVIECITSDLQRASESAHVVQKVVAKNLNIELKFKAHSAFREFHAGKLQNYTVDEYIQKFPGELQKYFADSKNDPWHSKYPGEHAESWSMVSARIAPFIRNLNTHFLELLAKDPLYDVMANDSVQDIFIWSTHGGMIRNILSLMHIFDLNHSNLSLGNGDVLLLKPSHFCQNRNEQHKLIVEKAFDYDCNVAWDLLKHVPVGDASTVLTDISKHLK